MKTGYLHDLDTIASYCPFCLCLLAPLSFATSRTLVIIWRAATAGVQNFSKKQNRCKFLDANITRVALEFWDIGWFACLYRGTFGQIAFFQKR
jgi:hypothetical protein